MIPTCIQAVVFHSFGLQDIERLLFVIFLLCCSALVSGAEAAFFSLSPRQIGHLEDEPSKANQTILKLLHKPDSLLATILIANNLVNISIVIVSNAIIDSWIDFQDAVTWEFVVKMVVVTFMLLLFGEIIPKIFASYNAMRTAQFMAFPLQALETLFKPISYVLIRSSSRINETIAKNKASISMSELSNAIEITSDQTLEEKRILSGIVDFVNTEVVEIMKPRMDIVMLNIEDDFDRVKRVIISSGFSRIPVYAESADHIQGVLFVKDMLPYINEGKDFDWKPFCRKPNFVPEHKMINDLLEEFQSQKSHMAIVVDEYGSTVGLVSLEDILEEIVGEIADESDREHATYIQTGPNTYLFEGKTHLSQLLQVLKLEDTYLDYVKGEAETIAGLMLEIRKDFLTQGDEITCRSLTLKAEEVTERRIDKVKVTVNNK